MPYVKQNIASGDTITSAWGNTVQTQYDEVMKEYQRVPGYGATTGSANAYALALDPPPSAYVDGLAVVVKINVDSTGAATLNVNGLGAKPIKKSNGTDFTTLKSGGIYALRYNATTGNFILTGEGGDYQVATGTGSLTAAPSSSMPVNITGLIFAPATVFIRFKQNAVEQYMVGGYLNGKSSNLMSSSGLQYSSPFVMTAAGFQTTVTNADTGSTLIWTYEWVAISAFGA